MTQVLQCGKVLIEEQQLTLCKVDGASFTYTSPPHLSLKVPKCEIFHLFDFNDFYGIKSL